MEEKKKEIKKEKADMKKKRKIESHKSNLENQTWGIKKSWKYN